MVSEKLFQFTCNVSAIHDIDNSTDYAILSTSFNISVEYAHTVVQNEAKLVWVSATATDIDVYKNNIDQLLEHIALHPDILRCTDHECTVHHDVIEFLHDKMITCCLAARDKKVSVGGTNM